LFNLGLEIFCKNQGVEKIYRHFELPWSHYIAADQFTPQVLKVNLLKLKRNSGFRLMDIEGKIR
jgi:hypothetical protein